MVMRYWFFWWIIFRFFTKTFLYYLLLHRILIVFKDSSYNTHSNNFYIFLQYAWIPM